jgi:hypothetical protein
MLNGASVATTSEVCMTTHVSIVDIRESKSVKMERPLMAWLLSIMSFSSIGYDFLKVSDNGWFITYLKTNKYVSIIRTHHLNKDDNPAPKSHIHQIYNRQCPV